MSAESYPRSAYSSSGSFLRRPDPWEVEEGREQLGVVTGVRSGGEDGQRHPDRLIRRVCSVPGFRRSTGRPGLVPAGECPDLHAVDHGEGGVRLAGLPEQLEEVGVEPVPDPALLPRPDPAVDQPEHQISGGTSSHRLPVARTNQSPRATARCPALSHDARPGRNRP